MKKKMVQIQKNENVFYYKTLRLADDYQYESDEEKEEEQQQSSKTPDKTEPRKKPTKDDFSGFNEWVNGKETGMNCELFQKHFKFQRPSDMLKSVYKTNDKKNMID